RMPWPWPGASGARATRLRPCPAARMGAAAAGTSCTWANRGTRASTRCAAPTSGSSGWDVTRESTLVDELTRLRWTCTILEYVRREGHWGLRDVDVLRCLLGGSSDGWLLAMEPDLHRW